MLRAIWLTIENEARLLLKDPIVLSMLLLAPVVIIAVAGYSLGDLYGAGANSFRLPVVDLDHGDVASGIIKALRHERSVTLEPIIDPNEAERLVTHRDRTPFAIEIPRGTSEAIVAGRQAHLIVFVDPVRRIEVNALELRLGELCREVTAQADATAQKRLDDANRDLRGKLDRLAAAISREQSQIRSQMGHTQRAISASIRAQMAGALEEAHKQTAAIVKMRESQVRADVQSQLASREDILFKILRYLTELQTSQRALEQWLAKLKEMAGSRASDIPAPPAFPEPLSGTDFAELVKPFTVPSAVSIPTASAPLDISIRIPKLPALGESKILSELQSFKAAPVPTLPGGLGLAEQPASPGGAVIANAFDQYVPGFGVTFLLIGMLLGISLALFDERDWGTLKRLQVSGAPLTGILLGKLTARFIVGTVQMVLLFAVGWALFGISLGRQPVALLIPTIGISFASAAFGLLIAPIARSHDGVMPLGTVTSMAMSAIGGCWWPLDFEPGWMRAVARWLPTTWTMQAYNDLMIRRLPASAAVWPFAATVGLGLICLAVGILGMLRLEE